MEAAQKRLDDASAYPKQVFVFVHGFHVSFENALCRTAQIAYDLNFDGAPFLFTWPSGDGYLSYFRTNQENEKIAADHLTEFLEKIVANTNATKIHLIAHSMGNTVLLDALDKLSGYRSNMRFAEIVMHSPDVGSNRFRQVMTAIKGLGTGETLYASTKDRALGISGWLTGEKAGGIAAVFPGVETIDVTAAGSSFLGLNHDIYATNPAIFNDMRLVLEFGTHPPDKRSALFRPKTTNRGIYWLYRPPEIAGADKNALPVGTPGVEPVAPQQSETLVNTQTIGPTAPISQATSGAELTTASIPKAPKATFKEKSRSQTTTWTGTQVHFTRLLIWTSKTRSASRSRAGCPTSGELLPNRHCGETSSSNWACPSVGETRVMGAPSSIACAWRSQCGDALGLPPARFTMAFMM